MVQGTGRFVQGHSIMPKQILALEEGGPPRLTLAWEGDYMRQFTVSLDGEIIGRIEGGQSGLREENRLHLPDGSLLTIQLIHSFFVFDDLHVLRDGSPLPGSAGDPRRNVTATVRTTFYTGLFFLVFGLAALFGVPVLRSLIFTPLSAVAGIALIALAIPVARCSSLAVWMAIGVLTADGVLTIRLPLQAVSVPDTLPLFVIMGRVAVILILLRGPRAMRQVLEARKRYFVREI
jgi:hypothetical protein